jgi:antitoxin HicB
MKTFAYAASFEPGKRRGVVVASFPDVPEAITEGDGIEDARRMAADALGTALLAYVRAGRPLPRARRAGKNAETIAVEPEVAAKLAVLMAFADAGMSQREFARRLGKDEREIRRLLDPMHPTKIGALDAALKVLGRRLVVGVETLPGEAA